MKTIADYLDSIHQMHFELDLFREKATNRTDHPVILPIRNCMAATYKLAEKPEYNQLMTVTSHITGRKIPRFTHINQSTEEQANKSRMGRLLGAHTGSCFQRCGVMDSLNTLSMVTYDMARKSGTEYHQRFLKYVQAEDLVRCGAMANGNRSLRSVEQPNPDQHLHIIKETKDSVILRGCKLHQPGALNSHEIIAMPTPMGLAPSASSPSPCTWRGHRWRKKS